MHFGENQLSLSLIGLSPLSTGHPRAFQRPPVRSSMGSYPHFNLPMDRSLSFGSAATDYGPHKMLAFYGYPSRPFQTRFRFGSGSPLNLAGDHNSQAHYAKGSPSPRPYGHGAPNDCRQAVSGSISLPSLGFFSPFPHGTCSLSVWQEYLALEGGPPIFTQDFTCPELLARPPLSPTNRLSGTGLSPSLVWLSSHLP